MIPNSDFKRENMSPPQKDRPLDDAERDRLDAILSRFHSQYALNNAEKVDGFFAALICSPEIARPSQYLPEIWGGEMTDDEAFDNQEQFQEFLSLLMRHRNSVGRIFEEEEIFIPLLFVDEEGTAHGNDWARGFMRGTHMHHESWKELVKDEEHAGPLVPIMALAYEHDPDPEMRPYKDEISAERREKLILGVAAGVTAIYEYFGPERRRIAAELSGGRTSYRQAERKIGRNDPCGCGSGKKYKHCCGKATL
jgi:uncharacterized protein